MILKSPVDVDLYDFITNGTFDYIKIGQTKEWILNNFPDPDYTENNFHMTKKGSIWEYGNIEFHFDDNILYLIFCDNFSAFDEVASKLTADWDAGIHINLNKWIFERANNLKCNEFITILNKNKINFSLFHNPNLRNVVIRILKSNVELVFEKTNDDRSSEDANEFNLVAFCLGREDVSNIEPCLRSQ